MSSSQAAVAAKTAGAFQRFVVAPCMNTARKIEHRSATKMQRMEPRVAEWVQAHEATGADAASASTKRFLCEQKQMMSYRVVRFFEECRYIASGNYCKEYTTGAALQDARFLTQLLFIFIVGVLTGRQSIYPPIKPDSPLAVALEHKTNPNY